MKIIQMKCPSCGADLEVDGNKHQIFCSYCGTKIMLDEEIKKVQIDGIQTESAKEINIKNLQESGQYEEALRELETIVKLNPKESKYAKQLVEYCNVLLDQIIDIESLVLIYGTTKSQKERITFTQDDVENEKLFKNLVRLRDYGKTVLKNNGESIAEYGISNAEVIIAKKIKKSKIVHIVTSAIIVAAVLAFVIFIIAYSN